jgi:hypothetical protein
MRYKLICNILILLCLTYTLSGQAYSEKRTYRKSVAVNREMTLEVNNKYGVVHISSGTADSVEIKAEIEATGSSQDRIDKMLQGVEVNISETDYLVRAQTDFNQTISMLLEGFKSITNKLIPYESRIQINYSIVAPEFLNIRIVNKYGDVYLENSAGSISVDLSNGSFKANSLSGSTSLNFNFCDATINNLKDARLEATFSDLTIGESGKLTVSSISSKFDITKSLSLDTKSRRDKFYIGNVSSLTGNSYFSEYRIENLDKEIILDSKYGRIEADHIGKNCEMVNITSGYTDVYLTFDPAMSYSFDVRSVNSFLVLPRERTDVEKETVNEDRKEYINSGKVGKNQGNLKVVIEATRGNIYLK